MTIRITFEVPDGLSGAEVLRAVASVEGFGPPEVDVYAGGRWVGIPREEEV